MFHSQGICLGLKKGTIETFQLDLELLGEFTIATKQEDLPEGNAARDIPSVILDIHHRTKEHQSAVPGDRRLNDNLLVFYLKVEMSSEPVVEEALVDISR